MAVTFNTSSSSTTGAATATALNITLPTWTVTGGDWIVLIFASSVGGGVPATDPTANGYTLQGAVRRNTNGATIAMWTKRAVPADSGSTTGMTYLTTQFMTFQAHVYSGAGGIGVNVQNPTTDSAVASTTTGVLSALTPTQGSGVLVGAINGRGGSALPVITQSTPSGWTNQLISSTALVSSNNCSLNAWNLTGYGTGSSAGNSTFGATQFFASMVLEILPLAAPLQGTSRRAVTPRKSSGIRTTKAPLIAPGVPAKFVVQRRTPRGFRRKTAAAVVPVAQVAVTPPNFVPVSPPRRFLRLIRGRGTAAQVPLTQVATPAPNFVRTAAPTRGIRFFTRRPRGATVSPAQPKPPVNTMSRRFYRIRARAMTALVPLTQVAALPPNYVPVSPPRRFLRFLRGRGGASMVPLTQIAVPAPRFVPVMPARRGLRAVRRRTFGAVPVPLQTAPISPSWVPQGALRRGIRLFVRTRRAQTRPGQQLIPSIHPVRQTRRPSVRTRSAQPPITQVTPVTPVVAPVQMPKRGIRVWARRNRTVNPVPVQVAAPPPTYVPQPPPKRAVRAFLRRAFGFSVPANQAPPVPVIIGYTLDLTEVIQTTNLWRTTRGYTAWRIAGVWHFGHTPDDKDLAGSDLVYRGGYNNTVSVAIGQALIAAGANCIPIYG